MVFSTFHWLPSAIAAILTVIIALGPRRKLHKYLSIAAVLFALFGLIGYLSAGNFRFYPLDIHTIHSWIGLSALLLYCYIFIDGMIPHKPIQHCRLGYITAALSVIALIMGLAMLSGIASIAAEESSVHNVTFQSPVSSKLPEVEAKEYLGVSLEPLRSQGNNAIQGTQFIDRASYRLKVTGLIDNETSWSYDELLGLQAYSEVVYMPCVEGWGFNAKWTGFRVRDLLNRSGIRP